jgi:hypothetical protein
MTGAHGDPLMINLNLLPSACRSNTDPLLSARLFVTISTTTHAT